MTEINVVNLSELMFHGRLDAEFYKPSYLKLYSLLEKISKKYQLLKLPYFLTIPVRTGSTPGPEERIPLLDGTDVMFIKTDSVRKGYINYEFTDLIPLDEHEKRKSTSLKKGDIVVTVVGATHEIIGRAGLYLKDSEANINQSDAVIRVDPKKIEPGYLSTFINSRYGRTQLWRYSGQTGQVTMNCREVEELLVLMLPKNFRKKINKMVLESEKLREGAKKIYKDAERLLLRELKFSDSIKNKKVTYIKQFSEIQKNNRIDAEYCTPENEKILRKIFSYNKGTFKLNEKNIKSKNFLPKDKQSYKYIELSNINSSMGIVESCMIDEGANLPTRARRLVNEGEVILSSIEGSMENSALITQDYDKSLCSTGFFVLSVENIYYPEFLLLVMKNVIFQKLLKRGCSGTILASISKEELMKIPLPKIDKTKQQEIIELIKKTNSLYKKSQNLLNEAKIKLEKFIEEKL